MAIDSIREQTYQDWEMVIVDDASTDGTPRILEEYASLDRRIRVFYHPRNLGVSMAMNRGITQALGEFIAVQEQDDFSTPLRLEREVAVLENDPGVGLVSGIADWLDNELHHQTYFPGILANGGRYPSNREAMFQFLYLEQCKIVNAGCMFRREAVRHYPEPYGRRRVCGDWSLFMRIAREWRIEGLPEVVVRMRRGNKRDSVTTDKQMQFREARRVITQFYREFRASGEPRLNRALWRRSMSNELILEARTFGRFGGLVRLAQAALLSPGNPTVWRAAKHWGARAAGKLSLASTGSTKI